MSAFTITHRIQPPSSFATPDSAPPTTDTFSYPLDTSSPLAHLQSLEQQLGLARNDLNERLTVWKDLLKDVEKEDKKKKKKRDDDEDDDGEDDDE
ncbi:uncharacterized protein JCM15063_002526 [Sporobolomyces koalae]|uniref:uncharacterized protein n=1 Tax=Sporobolomyces koalae TaxID=500713 RepID=UPI00317BEEE6